MALLEVKNLRKVYTTRLGGNKVQALDNVNFSVEQGEYVAIMGESGSAGGQEYGGYQAEGSLCLPPG